MTLAQKARANRAAEQYAAQWVGQRARAVEVARRAENAQHEARIIGCGLLVEDAGRVARWAREAIVSREDESALLADCEGELAVIAEELELLTQEARS